MKGLKNKNFIYKPLLILLCLGLGSGIVFYLNTGIVKSAGISTSVTITACGNGIVESGEGCDDGNTVSGDGCSAACQPEEVPSQEPSWGGGGGSVSPEITTKVVLQGRAYPNADIHILEGGKELLIVRADEKADFEAEIVNIVPGFYTFSFWASDKNNIKSISFNVSANVVFGTFTTIKGIFIPPTISLSKESVNKGETLNVVGQTAPNSEVEIFIEPEKIIESVTAEMGGEWVYNLRTDRFKEGIYNIKARSKAPDGFLSIFSNALRFGIGLIPSAEGACPNGDLNKDGKVNLIDFSILLYWWGKNNECADQNSDGIVNLIDFSIMLYYWTG